MHSPQSQEVVVRFFRALQYLIDAGEIKSRNWYCKEYGFVQSHLWRVEKDPGSKIFEISWMTPLITEYSISANWLMTGTGSMVFKSPPDGAKKLVTVIPEKDAICPSCANVVQE